MEPERLRRVAQREAVVGAQLEAEVRRERVPVALAHPRVAQARDERQLRLELVHLLLELLRDAQRRGQVLVAVGGRRSDGCRRRRVDFEGPRDG